MKIVINKCRGGYSLSDTAIERYAELAGIHLYTHRGTFGPVFLTSPVEEYLETFEEERHAAHFKGFQKSNAMIFQIDDVERTDPILIQVVEELGNIAGGRFADLKIIKIPDDVDWYIEEDGGRESVHEIHRIWQ